MLPAIALALGLGVGAADSNTIVVRVDGKETRVTLAGVSAGNARAAEFANCLVAGRVVRIKGSRSAATATLLDDSSVAAHINEFMQSATSANPCTIGRAAYEPVRPPVTTAAAAAPEAKAAAPGKKPVRQIHVSFAPGPASKPAALPPAARTTNEYANTVRRPAPAAQPAETPTYAAPETVRMYQPPQAAPYTMPVVTAQPALPQQGTQQALPQQGTQPMMERGPQPVPTTTYPPQPPL
jgi:hypothetical protein